MNAVQLRARQALVVKGFWKMLALPILIIGMTGCGGQKDFDPKALSAGDSPEMKQANSSMEDFMKTQGKAKSK